jgi:hypothetical protein
MTTTHSVTVPRPLAAGVMPNTTYGARRLCAYCGGRLSRYNPEDACGPCARRETLAGNR